MNKKYIKCPLNYVGGKTGILDQILPLFPNAIDTYVEPFCGGFNVGINVVCNKAIAIDINKYLIELFNYFSNNDASFIVAEVEKIVKKYELNLTNTNGYNSLRDDYNKNKNPLFLFVLTCFSFNHQIRYNNDFNFNTPFGKNRSSYNKNIKENLIDFINKCHEINTNFICGDFRKASLDSLDSNSFVYCDPPYLITTGSYNDGKRGFGDWKEKDELDLLNFLDYLNSKNIRFGLSNVFVHNGGRNDLLIKWSEKYNVHFIDKNYNNSNYQSSAKEHKTVEVFITNY